MKVTLTIFAVLKSYSRKFLSSIFYRLLILVRENSRSLPCYNLGIGIEYRSDDVIKKLVLEFSYSDNMQ